MENEFGDTDTLSITSLDLSPCPPPGKAIGRGGVLDLLEEDTQLHVALLALRVLQAHAQAILTMTCHGLEMRPTRLSPRLDSKIPRCRLFAACQQLNRTLTS